MSQKQKRTTKASSPASKASPPSSIPEIVSQERFPLLRVLRITGILFLHVGLISMANSEWRLWGFHHIAFLPLWASTVILFLGGLLLTPFGRPVVGKLTALLSVLANRSAWLWALLSLALFFGLRITVPLLGDSQLWIRELTWIGELTTQGAEVKAGRIFMRKEPLSLALHEATFEVMRMAKPYKPSITAGSSKNKQRDARLNYFRDLARDSYAYMSMLAGALTVLILIRFARRHILPEKRAPFFLMMMSGGGLLLFFGYIENYSWTSFWIIACLLSGISEALSRNRFPWKTLLLFLVAVGFHYAAIILLPGILFLIINLASRAKDIERKNDSAPAKRTRQLTLIFLVLGLVGYIYVKGWEGWISVIPLLPQWSKDSYSFVSPTHWIDLLNLFALSSLAAVAVWISLKPNDSPTHSEHTLNGFLKLSAGAGIVFVLLFNPNLGMARDWDILATAIWPLVLVSAWQIAHVKSVNRTALISALCGIIILVSLPSILVNRAYTPSIDRFKTLLAIDEPRAAYGWENLALHYQRRGEIENRVDAWKHAVEIERNPRYVFNYADAMKLSGHMDDAVPYYIEAALMMRDSEIKIYRELLLFISAALIAEEKFGRAREVLDVAVEIIPDNDYPRRLLFMLDDAVVVDSLIKVEDYEGAKAATLSAREKDPQNSYWVKLYNRIKRLEGSRKK